MKVGNIVESNQKGQIVIPKKMRDDLEITPNTPLNIIVRGGGIYIYPVEAVLTKEDSKDMNKAYLEVLRKTRGILGPKPYYKSEKARRKMELDASRKRKKAW